MIKIYSYVYNSVGTYYLLLNKKLTHNDYAENSTAWTYIVWILNTAAGMRIII